MIFLGAIVGIILIVAIIAFIVYKKITNFTNSIGLPAGDLKSMIEQSEHEARYRPKSVSGMTSVTIPKIKNDFPNFSESELYTKLETSLNLIFNALSTKQISDSSELVIIRNNLEEKINSLKNNFIDISISDVVFHKHVIKEYNKSNGALHIILQTSLEYYYEEKQNNEVKVKRTDWKKQTSYTTEFIYVYNTDEFETTRTTIGARCPNCGAPVKALGQKSCEYCASGLEDLNLKSWFISSYKEDQR